MSIAFPIGDVLLFKEQEGQTKHVVAVEVCDEDGFNLSGGDASTTQAQQGCRRCIDDVFPIKDEKGMMALMR